MDTNHKQDFTPSIYVIIIMLGIIIGLLFHISNILKESYNDQHWMTGMMEQIYDKMK